MESRKIISQLLESMTSEEKGLSDLAGVNQITRLLNAFHNIDEEYLREAGVKYIEDLARISDSDLKVSN